MKNKEKKEVKKSFLEKNKLYIISFLVAVFLILLIILFLPRKNQPTYFEECVREGNIVEESLPKKCFTKEGRVFVEDLGEEITFERVSFDLKNPIVNERSADILNDIYSFREVFGNESFDFNKNSLIVVFSGEKPTGGYSIEIKKIIKKKDRFVVYAEEKIPGRDCFLIQVISYPHDIVKIEKTSLSRVELVVEQKIQECGKRKGF